MDKFVAWFSRFLPSWLKVSNRPLHILYSLPCGFLGGPLFILGLALGMEYKDKLWGGKFDWLDILAILIGGLPGSIFWILF